MTPRKAAALIAAIVVAAACAPAAAQVPELTVERIWGSKDFDGDLVPVRWMADGKHYTVSERDSAGGTNLYRVEAISGKKELLVRAGDLTPPQADRPIAIEGYEFSPDGSKLLIYTNSVRVWRLNTKGTYYIWDFTTRRLTPLSTKPGYQMFAKFSPDGRRVGFVRENNIFVTELATGEERAVTTDGDDDIINGTTDWVYEEELGLRDAFRWSPDGQRIAFWRFDQSAIRPFYLIDEMSLYPEISPVRYPKAGTPNSQVRIGVVELRTGAVTWIDLGSENDAYIARMDFADSPTEIWLQRLNRHQNRMDLLLADTRTGRSRVLMTDTDSAWLDLHEPIWIEGGKRFLYVSERDGYAQAFLYNRDGALVRKVTRGERGERGEWGEWDVLDVYGVDERAKVVYFTAAIDGPLVRPLYRIGLDGRGLKRISVEPGTHAVSFNPTFTLYVDTHSRAGVPPVQTLRRANGSPVRTLSGNEALRERVRALGLRPPEFLKVPAANGMELNAYLIRPKDFDPAKRYPLLLYVYGGPGSQTVTDAWDGKRYLWHQMLAQQGYLVASVDNRGTGARGARFKKVTYLRLGKIEAEDQIAAARHFATLPYVDATRIGIWGWSYGGFMAVSCVLRAPEVFTAAISVAPVTDWRLYDTIYTERYMRTPQENPEGYDETSVLRLTDRLAGRLLLVHGTGDDNVHPQNTTQLVNRLVAANKQFELRLYPNKTHSINDGITRVNLYTLLTEWLRDNL